MNPLKPHLFDPTETPTDDYGSTKTRRLTVSADGDAAAIAGELQSSLNGLGVTGLRMTTVEAKGETVNVDVVTTNYYAIQVVMNQVQTTLNGRLQNMVYSNPANEAEDSEVAA